MMKVVIDTDTYNEIDDQFALSYLLRSEKAAGIMVEAIYAAPFFNDRSSGAEDGMNKSFEEIERLLKRLNRPDIPHFRGATYYLSDDYRPDENAAVLDLIERAKNVDGRNKLQVIAIGALTNLASAILLEPKVIENCHLIWLGGNALHYPHNREFNLLGDIKAVETVFDSGIELTVAPCMGVASHFTTCREELSLYLDLEDPLCSFLYNRFSEYIPEGMGVKEIWDVVAVAVVLLPKAIKTFSYPTPRIAPDGSYILDPRRKTMEFVYEIDRNIMYQDLYNKLSPKSVPPRVKHS
jgi:inosine-uridine nucleoside N-ribohydrolase